MERIKRSEILSPEIKDAMEYILFNLNESDKEELETLSSNIIEDLNTNYHTVGLGKIIQALIVVIAELEFSGKELQGKTGEKEDK